MAFKREVVKKVKPDQGNIRDFDRSKLLYSLIKPKAQNAIKIIQDDEDPSFLSVLTYKPKNGEITDNNFIISKDLDTWLSHLSGMGYQIL